MKEVAIFTTTLYPDPSNWRAKCAIETARKAFQLDVPFVTVDSTSHAEFLDALKNEGAIILQDESGGKPFGACRRQALRYIIAQGLAQNFFWMEPEKTSMLDDLHQIFRPIVQNDADMVTPNRIRLFETYPIEQAHSESYGNLVFQIATGKAWDIFAGPVAFNAAAAAIFLKYNEDGIPRDDRWDSTIIPRIEIAATLRGRSVDTQYAHPPKQTQAEASNPVFVKKRLEQLNNLCPMIWAEAARFGLPRA